MRRSILPFLLVVLLLGFSSSVYADYQADIGFSLLESMLGEEIPDGEGVPVVQVEALQSGHWMPNRADADFVEKNIVDKTGGDTGSSSHATTVGKYFYGNTTSTAPGIGLMDGDSSVWVYEANNWTQAGFLRFNYYNMMPDTCSARVANHSWVTTLPPEFSGDILRRVDWLVQRDEFIQVAALNNGSTSKELLGNAFNVIAVGRTDGIHPIGSAAVDGVYAAGRTRPDLVVPFTATSYAAPVVSAAAVFLVDAGSAPGLSADPVETWTTNRNGDIILNAARSEVVKAALMTGADRFTANTGSIEITDYRMNPVNQTENGLDRRYGAGQVNLYNSYLIVTSGEQDSLEDAPDGEGLAGFSGFDYDPDFGGAYGSNDVASYFLTADTAHTLLTASLVWNIRIEGGSGPTFDGAATLHNLDLYLYDVTSGGVEVARSSGTLNNTENLFVSLTKGHDYLLQVVTPEGQESFRWDYALAWQVRTDLNGDMKAETDADGDGLPNEFDNCMLTANAGQQDEDDDGYGNACDCDLNNDGVVNALDFSIFKKDWFKVGPSAADFNSDNVVNALDFTIFKSRWFTLAPWY